MKPNIDQVASNGDDNSAAKIGQSNITKSSGHERKRTANLESLIGNLKVRKMNVKSDYESSASANGNKKQLNSIYVEVTNNSMSDCCSRSTPPLSSSSPSSSVSPTSSMSPDSPIQSNASSSFSSLSSSSNNASLNSSTNNGNNCKSGGAVHASSRLLPSKYEWLAKVAENDQEKSNRIKEENSVGEVDEEDLEEQQPVDFLKCKSDDETDTIKDTMNGLGWAVKSASNNNNMMIMDDMDEASGESENEDIDEDEDLLHARQGQTSQVMSSSSSSTASVSKPGKKAAKHVNKNHFNYKIVHADGKNGDEAGGSGGRAVKFYDDFIDFRGDILRRPPNSKNCRILWEYLFLLLQDPNYSSVIKWEDESNMVFRIVQAEKLAALWGLQKNRLGMTYEKLSRGMRYYYPNNIIAREPGRRLLYRFMRHPDDIKKFVKKNGTYMLKKTKSTSKGGSNPDEMGSPSDDLDDSMNTTELNPDDSGVDEPFNTMNKMSVKKQTATGGKSAGATARRKPAADEENNDATNNNQDTENNVFSISKNKSFNNNDNDNRNHLKANNFLSQQQQQQASSNPMGLYNDLYLYSAQMAAATYLQNLMSNSGKIEDVNSLLMQQLRNNSNNMNEIANQNLLENNNNNNAKFPNLNDQVLMYLKYFNNNNSSTNNNNKSPSANSYSSTHSSSSSSSDNNNNSITYASKKFNTNSHHQHHHNSASSFNESLLEQHNPLNLTMSKSSNSLLMKKAKK